MCNFLLGYDIFYETGVGFFCMHAMENYVMSGTNLCRRKKSKVDQEILSNSIVYFGFILSATSS